MSDEDKPKLALKPLGVKRTTEVSQVKQSFSHGRTHKVVVETKKARVFRKPGEEPPADVAAAAEPAAAHAAVPKPVAGEVALEERPARADMRSDVRSDTRADAPVKPVAPPPPFHTYSDAAPAEIAPRPEPAETVKAAPAPEPAPANDAAPAAPPVAEAPAVAPAPVPVPEAPKPSPELAAISKALQNPKLSARERQALMMRLAEEERLQRAEEARIRDERAKALAAEAERRRLEDKARAEAEAAARAAEEARLAAAPPAAAVDAVDPALGVDEDEAGRAGGAARAPDRRRAAEPAKPARSRVDDRRQGQKLTINRALVDEDGVRARSLASLRRQQAKQQRGVSAGGGAQAARQPREVQIPEAITVQELANRMAEKGAALVKALFKMGMATTITATIDQDTAELLVTEFGHTPRRVADSDVEIGLGGVDDRPEDLQARAPVVAVMGHVDHGKTSLLDALRGSDVAAGEAGGITQHIGAYQVRLESGERITFLDTPGHEAFTEMRARGANTTDIVVLVVAGDDGIMPQTVEAINHVKAAGVPMIVAINKMDKPGADAGRVRTELLSHDVQVESMGGEVLDVEVSALKRTGLDELAEKLLLQAEILELKANPERAGEGIVVEAKLETGRGAVATVLVTRGTLRQGDIFVVGAEWGKVRALVNDKGQQVKEAGPSDPVEVLGLSGVPQAGDRLSVVETEARAREIAEFRQAEVTRKRTAAAPASLESMFSRMKEDRAVEFPVVIKGDVHGSVEAIATAVNKLSTDEIRTRVLHSGVGGITESDVTLARASGALIVGFHVRANAKAREVANQAGVPIKYYDVIYDLLDEMKTAMAGKLGPEYFENVVGRAEVREVFSAGKFGKAAGVLVQEGEIRRNLKARVLREDVIQHSGNIASLRRFKDDVNEVRQGYECGVALEGFQDYQVGDIIETFEVEERLRSL
jgi:translation initiation factor IF-2